MHQPTPRIDWNIPITHAIGAGNYTMLYYPNGQRILTAYTIAKVTTWFSLVRIHKQVAVNPAYVESVEREGVKIVGIAIRLMVARRRLVWVRENLNKTNEPSTIPG